MKLIKTILRRILPRKKTTQDIIRKHRGSEVFWSDISYGPRTCKWYAKIHSGGYYASLGSFGTKEEAIRARAEAEALIRADLFKHYF